MRLHDFNAQVLMDNPTKAAVWLETENGDMWVPRSVLEMSEADMEGNVECTVPMLFAEQKGMV